MGSNNIFKPLSTFLLPVQLVNLIDTYTLKKLGNAVILAAGREVSMLPLWYATPAPSGIWTHDLFIVSCELFIEFDVPCSLWHFLKPQRVSTSIGSVSLEPSSTRTLLRSTVPTRTTTTAATWQSLRGRSKRWDLVRGAKPQKTRLGLLFLTFFSLPPYATASSERERERDDISLLWFKPMSVEMCQTLYRLSYFAMAVRFKSKSWTPIICWI